MEFLLLVVKVLGFVMTALCLAILGLSWRGGEGAAASNVWLRRTGTVMLAAAVLLGLYAFMWLWGGADLSDCAPGVPARYC